MRENGEFYTGRKQELTLNWVLKIMLKFAKWT